MKAVFLSFYAPPEGWGYPNGDFLQTSSRKSYWPVRAPDLPVPTIRSAYRISSKRR